MRHQCLFKLELHINLKSNLTKKFVTLNSHSYILHELWIRWLADLSSKTSHTSTYKISFYIIAFFALMLTYLRTTIAMQVLNWFLKIAPILCNPRKTPTSYPKNSNFYLKRGSTLTEKTLNFSENKVYQFNHQYRYIKVNL